MFQLQLDIDCDISTFKMTESLFLLKEVNAEDGISLKHWFLFQFIILESLRNQLKTLMGAKSGLFNVASKSSEKIFKGCLEIATSCDPLSTAINISGVNGLGLALSRLSASQCAGFFGLIVSSIHPQVYNFVYIYYLKKYKGC